ncbi:glycosyl transferase [Deinococcus metalli]|nr:glycosyl transferase [Deinococcus metalli]
MYSSGVTQVLYKLARYKQADLLEMSIASLDTPQKAMVEILKGDDVEVNHLGNSGVLISALALRRVMNRRSIDVVVANSFRSYLVAKAAALGSGTPVVYWVHTINQILTSRFRKLLYPLLTKNDPLLYVSQSVLENNRPAGHRGEDMVIYNSVEPPEIMPEWQPYPPEKRAEFDLPADAIVLGYTANFATYKDHPTLLRAFDSLSKRYQNLYLVLVGDGRTLDPARAQAKQFAASDRIRFLGTRHDARALLGLVDVYVHVSPEEAFGLAVVEAMLARRPVVAARAFALPELIRDGETGVLFEPGDAKDLERQVIRMIEDRAYAERLAHAGDLECRRRFPPEPFARQVTEFLYSVLSARSARTLAGEQA